MKKITKQALIWSSVAVGLGGLSAGIAVPIIKDHENRKNINPINLTGKETVADGMGTLQSLMDQDKSSIEVRNSKLLSNTEHQLAFFLYKEEQEASLKLQKAYFEWHKHEVVKNLKDFYLNTMHQSTAITGATIEAEYADAVAKIQAEVDKVHNNDDKKNRQKALDNMKKDWSNNLENIEHIKNNTVDYKADRFAEKYPKVSLPLAIIQERKQKIYNDQKQAFIDSNATEDAGKAAWFANLSKRFNGATTEAQAVEGLVFNEIKNKGYARFQYAIDSSFTYEQYQSGVFKEYLGDPSDTNYNGIAVKDHSEKTDKIFFLSSKSNIAKWFNPIMGKTADFEGFKNLTRTHNAILGFKQDKTNPNAPWTADKKMLENLFKVFVDGTTVHQVADAWTSIFKDTTAAEEQLTKRLVQNYSLTTDSTQSRSGDLGISTKLDSFAPMAPGFALGIISILNGDSTVHTDTTGGDFLTQLMNNLKTAFTGWVTKHGIALTTPTSGTTPSDLENIKEYNEQIKDILNNKMTADDLKVTFGTVIRDTFKALEAHHKGTSAGKKGIPLAIQIRPGVYGVVSEKFGLHIIKYEDNVSTTIPNELKDDLKKAVEKQDTKDIATNYAGLLQKKLTSLGKLYKVLGVVEDPHAADEDHRFTIAEDSDVMKFLKSKADELEYDSSNIAHMSSDIATMVGRLKKSEKIAEIQKAVQDATIKWLKDKLDNHLVVDGDMTIAPEELYNIVSAIEGGTV